VSTPPKPKPEAEQQPAKPLIARGGSKSDIARAKELAEKYGLQRLLHPKR
jgi:hypothetical protein